jgi:hypothetical protein
MTDVFTIIRTVGGQATTAASAAAALPSPNNGNSKVYRVVTDGYVRIEFGTLSASAGDSSPLFAPGEVYVQPNPAQGYYSVRAMSGTANYSITAGAVANAAVPTYFNGSIS